MPNPTKIFRRIDELDLLRGALILIIVVDHLQRWPSPFTVLTGEGRLWANAAQGFFIISGLLVGYIRGYKSLNVPMKDIATILMKRAGMLYIWSVIITIVVVALTKTLPVQEYALIPAYPNSEDSSSIPNFLYAVLTQQYVSDWIYFLRLYWIMLLVSPIVVWLFRRKLWWVVGLLSTAIYGLSLLQPYPEAALQWQFLFFVPSILGFYMETIIGWLRTHRRVWKGVAITLVSVTVVTLIASFYYVFGWSYELVRSHMNWDTYIETRQWLDPWFSNSPLRPGRVVLGLIWFGGFLVIFNYLKPYIVKYFGWLLFRFGLQSLNAYCLQAIILCFVQAFVPVVKNPFYNLVLTTVFLIGFWWLLRLKVVRKLFPS